MKNRILVDEKEMDNLFKDLLGDPTLCDRPKIRKTEFLRLFMRSSFKGAFQNVFDFINKSSIIIKSMPISMKIMYY